MNSIGYYTVNHVNPPVTRFMTLWNSRQYPSFNFLIPRDFPAFIDTCAIYLIRNLREWKTQFATDWVVYTLPRRHTAGKIVVFGFCAPNDTNRWNRKLLFLASKVQWDLRGYDTGFFPFHTIGNKHRHWRLHTFNKKCGLCPGVPVHRE